MKPPQALVVELACWVLASAEPSAQQPAKCSAAKAEFAIEQRYSPDLAQRAGQSAGARETRRLLAGGEATTDLREDRLNLQVDDQDVVRKVTCG